MSTYVGPARVECPMACAVPEGVTLAEVPPPRHYWSDVFRCPNGDEVECDRAFLVTVADAKRGDGA